MKIKLVLLLFLSRTIYSLSCSMKKKSQYSCICSVINQNCVEKLESFPKLTENDVVIYETRKNSSERLKQTVSKNAFINTFSNNQNSYKYELNIDNPKQEIIGFGGAITDASLITMNSLDNQGTNQILNSYFGKGQMEYSIARVPIASTDFSLGVYSYCDEPEDLELESFSLDVDRTSQTGYKLENIKYVKSLSHDHGKGLKFFASPWAPPSWMTNTGKVIKNPKLRNENKIKTSYTNYLKKFFEEYEKEGINFWGMTSQNEPDGNTGGWQSLVYTPEELRDFIRDYLGPNLKSSFPNLKIMMHDDQRYNLPKWPEVVLKDPLAAQYIDGIGIHWYESLEDTVEWLWRPFNRIKQTLQKYPNKFILGTEACNGSIITIPFLYTRGPILGDWKRGETYAYDIINDINAGVSGWTDWNLSLDMEGGPNWAKNNVDAPILVDTDSKDIYYKQPMFFYLMHFSHFINPGSKRLETHYVNKSFWNKIGISFEPQIISFKTTQNRIVVIVLNHHWWEKDFEIKLSDERVYVGKIYQHSIQTIVFNI